MAGDDDKYSKEWFLEYHDSCKVKSTQKAYKELERKAKAENPPLSPGDYIAANYTDTETWMKKECLDFPLTCSVTDLSELGSGTVMYFHLLKFLGGVLLVVSIFQIPMMATYSSADKLNEWQLLHQSRAYSFVNSYSNAEDNNNPCACIGKNNGERGPSRDLEGTDDEYGKTCGAWDNDFCTRIVPVGAWCCRPWCFARVGCPVSDESEDRYQGKLVRSYSACSAFQDLDTCSSFQDPDIFYQGSPSELPEDWAWSINSVSPGACGPNQCENEMILTMAFLTVFIICFSTIFLKQHQIKTDTKVDAEATTPNDFAIMVRGTACTSEGVIADWFAKNALKDEQVEIVKVVIGWDFHEFQEKMKEIKALRQSKGDLDPTDPSEKAQIIAINAKIKEISDEMKKVAEGKATDLQSSGIFVVVFRHQQTLTKIQKRWTGWHAKYRGMDNTDSKIWPTTPLPDFSQPDATYEEGLSIQRAPNAGDVHWEDLGQPKGEVVKKFLKTNALMFLLILITFIVIWGLENGQRAADRARRDMEGNDRTALGVLAFLVTPAIMISNMGLAFSAKFLGASEFHETWTTQECSQGFKTAVAQVFNTGGILLFTNARPELWYGVGGLNNQMLTLLLGVVCMPSIVGFFDIGWWWGLPARMLMTQAKLDNINAIFERGKPTSQEEMEEYKDAISRVNKFKEAYEPGEMNNARQYANALKTFTVTILFMPVFPLAPIIGVVGITMQYWVDKYMLLRKYKRSERPPNGSMASFSLDFIRVFVPLGLSLSYFIFLSPSWYNKDSVFSWVLSMILVSMLTIFTPMAVLRTLVGARCVFSKIEVEVAGDTEMDYYEAQHMWAEGQQYHKDQFLYKMLPEKANPTILVPGQNITDMSACRSNFGAAAQQAADSVGTSSERPITLAGGRRVAGPRRGARKMPCRYGAECRHFAEGRCKFEHKWVCRYGAKCRNKDTTCKYNHPAGDGSLPKGGASQRECKYGADCRTKDCPFRHPEPAPSPSPTSSPEPDAGAPRVLPPTQNSNPNHGTNRHGGDAAPGSACRHGAACFEQHKCRYTHPPGSCKYGSRCRNKDTCTYKHE